MRSGCSLSRARGGVRSTCPVRAGDGAAQKQKGVWTRGSERLTGSQGGNRLALGGVGRACFGGLYPNARHVFLQHGQILGKPLLNPLSSPPDFFPVPHGCSSPFLDVNERGWVC